MLWNDQGKLKLPWYVCAAVVKESPVSDALPVKNRVGLKLNTDEAAVIPLYGKGFPSL